MVGWAVPSHSINLLLHDTTTTSSRYLPAAARDMGTRHSHGRGMHGQGLALPLASKQRDAAADALTTTPLHHLLHTPAHNRHTSQCLTTAGRTRAGNRARLGPAARLTGGG